MVKKIIIAVLALSLFVFLCFYNATNVNTKQFKIREEKLVSEKIDDSCDGLLIAYFSDLALNSFLTDEYVNEVFNTVSSFQPDIILFGGDLLDVDDAADENRIRLLEEGLKNLHARYGKYAVLGDQDHRNEEKITGILKESDFTLLDNQEAVIAIDSDSAFSIIGIDSLVGGHPDLTAAFSSSRASVYTIALSHCPDIFSSVCSYDADLLLSGHSRGGQVWLPLISLFTREDGCQKYNRGKTTKDGTMLDITNGLGRISKDARFMADAEIVLYTLKAVQSE